MISLSKVIKSQWAESSLNEKKIISIKVFEHLKDEIIEVEPVENEIDIENVLREAELQAETIISKARQEAASLQQQLDEQRQAFQFEKEAIAEQAREEGYSAGFHEGQQKGYFEYQEIIQSAKQVVYSSKLDYEKHIESSEREILKLGLIVAEKILGKKLADHNEEFLSIVKRALKEARDYQEVQLHVHPVHYDLLLANKDELVMLFPKEVRFYIYPNDELNESSCFIESENGRIDASIDSQLEEIKRKLFELLEGE
ncbi:flagellar assembly protein FliH [Bacillus sp. Bva_UNVM-123]|uniref:flagellar assembly protein FliH n=1 Tax=Bacillus sp. Bva_UNVM-123 TaxID=2829798 RepID=UPI00391F28B1